MSRPTVLVTPGMRDFAEAVDEERQRQLHTWGDQRHPMGTSGHNFKREADAARRACQAAARNDTVTWFHIMREEFWEAMAETDPAKLQNELIQLAAVCQAMIHDLTRQCHGGDDDDGAEASLVSRQAGDRLPHDISTDK